MIFEIVYANLFFFFFLMVEETEGTNLGHTTDLWHNDFLFFFYNLDMTWVYTCSLIKTKINGYHSPVNLETAFKTNHVIYLTLPIKYILLFMASFIHFGEW